MVPIKLLRSILLDVLIDNFDVENFGKSDTRFDDAEKGDKETLLGFFRRAKRVEVYTKHDRWAENVWSELANWSTYDDVLFLLDGVGMLICIPNREAITNNLIEA